MLQKSVEDFAENDIKFKELVKDVVREELKFYKEHTDEQIREILELLKFFKKIEEITNKFLDIEGSSDGK